MLKITIKTNIFFLITWVGLGEVVAGDLNRHVNGIRDLLCMLHFPDLVMFGGAEEPAHTWEHYVAFSDLPDRDGRVFANKAERVVAELWVSLSHTIFLNTLHSLDILEIMT